MQRVKRISNHLINSVSRLSVQRYFAESLKADGVIVLLQGARGVGKTTALLQYLHAQDKNGVKALRQNKLPKLYFKSV